MLSNLSFERWLYLIGVLVLVALRPALAHPMPTSRVLLDLQPAGVAAEVQLPLNELQLALGQQLDVTTRLETLVARSGPALRAHVQPTSYAGQPWAVTVGDLHVSAAEQTATGSYQELTAQLWLRPPAGASSRAFRLRYDVIMHQVVTYTALVAIGQDWDNGVLAAHPVEVGSIRMDARDNSIAPLYIEPAAGSRWRGFWRMVGLGLSHIAEGTDHLLFLLLLLLPAPLVVRLRRWGKFGGVGYSAGRLLKIVTAFTLGHSLTLLLGALGTPSTTGTWMLQFGGHHLATNITFGGGSVTGATPKFEGVEPLSFVTANANIFPAGTTVAPLSSEQATMLAFFNSLTTTQKATAKLTQTFSDVLLGPNTVEGGNTTYPTTKAGLPCSQLTTAQQSLVVAAMAPWVQDADDVTAAALLNYYQTQLATTYISYSGTGNFTTNADYARIDGLNVWIEFVCQSGVVFRNQIRYHSIWRDRARDYGGNFYTTVTGTKAETAATIFSVYPNPVASGLGLDALLAKPTASATYTLRNMLGQTVASSIFLGSSAKVSTSGLTAGTYLLSVQLAGEAAVTSRVTLE